MEKTSGNPKRGRPPVDEPLKKRFFRCTDAEWAALCEVAAGGNRSQLIRSLIVAEIADHRLLTAVARVGHEESENEH